MEKDQNTNSVEQNDKSEELKADKLDNEAKPDDSENIEPEKEVTPCLLYTSPSPRDATLSRMPSSA